MPIATEYLDNLFKTTYSLDMAKPKGPVLPRNLVEFVETKRNSNKWDNDDIKQWLSNNYERYRDAVRPHETPRKSLGVAGMEILREDLYAVLVHLYLDERDNDTAPASAPDTATAPATTPASDTYKEEWLTDSLKGHLWFGLGLALLQDKAWRDTPMETLVSYLDDTLPFDIDGDYREGVIRYLTSYAESREKIS